MVIRVGVMSDLHIEHDVALTRRAMAHAVQGITGGVAVNWWRHLNAREAEPGHPLYGPDLTAVRGVDLLLLAGDIWHGVDGIAYADAAAAYCGCPAVMVSGNHDLYGSDMAVMLPRMAAAAEATGGRVRFLDDARADFLIGGRRLAVLGGTLWTDYRLNGAARQVEAMAIAGAALNDHRLIALNGRPFSPASALERHERSRAWLAEAASKARANAAAVIIVVHHAVVPEANAVEHRGGALSPAFASDLGEDIPQWEADLIVSGHTHAPLDLTVGKTRLVSAPRGYIGTENGVDRYAPSMVEIAE